MSTYKVIQDIEAEDKLLGPLTLRQFIFAVVAVMLYYFSYLLISKHVGILTALFLPPAFFATFFAIPFGGDQPTEIWALAKIRFWFKPRRRIWDQSGAKDLVTITVPKKIKVVRTDGLSQFEVRSRLSALANTIDSRGWAVKNVNLNVSAQSSGPVMSDAASDRLVEMDGLPQEVPSIDVQAADDILDEQNNPIAHQFEQMIAAATQAHRQQIMTMMSDQKQAMATGATQPTWFTDQPTAATPPPTGGPVGMVQAAEPTAEEQSIGQQLKVMVEQERAQPAANHLKTLQPLAAQPADDTSTPVVTPAEPAMTATPNPAILDLAKNNDLDVATLARQAHKQDLKESGENSGEVVISLR